MGHNINIFYTKSIDDEQSTHETVHIRLSYANYQAITVQDAKVRVLGGNDTNIHDPELPYQSRMQIDKIFQAIYAAMEQ